MSWKSGKYTPEIIEKWAKGLKSGSLDYEAIKQRWGARNDYVILKVNQYWEGIKQ